MVILNPQTRAEEINRYLISPKATTKWNSSMKLKEIKHDFQNCQDCYSTHWSEFLFKTEIWVCQNAQSCEEFWQDFLQPHGSLEHPICGKNISIQISRSCCEDYGSTSRGSQYLCNHTSSANSAAVANRNSWQDDDVPCNPAVFTDCNRKA